VIRTRAKRVTRREIFHDSIAERAYNLFERRGRINGRDFDDWVQAERELAGGQTYRVGILIIGSLFWDRQRSHREDWRRENLTADRVAVRVPIRYGRRSNDRNGTYTMVFSNELCPDRLGSAIAVACRRRIRDGTDLAKEAEALWDAEQTTARRTGRVSATWGAVGLLCNPNTKDLESIRASWTARTAQ
jgi:hypothetical protein